MIITLTPEDLIKRCLWLDYKKFALRDKNEQEIQKIIKENKPMSLSEDLGYVIGLLKVIETDNLVHRFKSHIIKNIIEQKSTIITNEKGEKGVYISVKIIENELENFKKRFPEYWIADSTYEKSIKDVLNFIRNIQEEIKNFEAFEFKIKDKKIKYFQSKDIKKIVEI